MQESYQHRGISTALCYFAARRYCNCLLRKRSCKLSLLVARLYLSRLMDFSTALICSWPNRPGTNADLSSICDKRNAAFSLALSRLCCSLFFSSAIAASASRWNSFLCLKLSSGAQHSRYLQLPRTEPFSWLDPHGTFQFFRAV